jgi:hypothetical protein
MGAGCTGQQERSNDVVRQTVGAFPPKKKWRAEDFGLTPSWLMQEN